MKYLLRILLLLCLCWGERLVVLGMGLGSSHDLTLVSRNGCTRCCAVCDEAGPAWAGIQVCLPCACWGQVGSCRWAVWLAAMLRGCRAQVGHTGGVDRVGAATNSAQVSWLHAVPYIFNDSRRMRRSAEWQRPSAVPAFSKGLSPISGHGSVSSSFFHIFYSKSIETMNTTLAEYWVYECLLFFRPLCIYVKHSFVCTMYVTIF